MERSYVALPYEYREELSVLSDAALGKLVRALMEYSLFGVEPQDLPKTARMFWPRLRSREDRYQAQFAAQAERYSSRARKAAEARWGLRPEEMPEASSSIHTDPHSDPKTKTKTDFYSEIGRAHV